MVSVSSIVEGLVEEVEEEEEEDEEEEDDDDVVVVPVTSGVETDVAPGVGVGIEEVTSCADCSPLQVAFPDASRPQVSPLANESRAVSDVRVLMEALTAAEWHGRIRAFHQIVTSTADKR